MTTIQGNSAIDALNGGAKATAAKSNDQVDQNTFLKLLTTQMQNQDPFNPIDNTQMVAQMAQFSSVAGIAEMNVSLKGIASDIAASRIGDAASWIGRAALVEADTAPQFSDGSYAGEIMLPKDVTNMTVSLIDRAGRTVYSRTSGPQSAGPVAFAWDGKDEAGNPAAEGPLQVRVSAVDSTGVVTPSVSTWVAISGVQSPAGGATRLVTPLGLIAPTEAQRLS